MAEPGTHRRCARYPRESNSNERCRGSAADEPSRAEPTTATAATATTTSTLTGGHASREHTRRVITAFFCISCIPASKLKGRKIS